MRTVLAFVAAALAPVSLMAGWFVYDQFSIFPRDDPYIWVRTRGFIALCLTISSLHVLLLGVPAYAVLRWKNAIRWWSSLAAGFLLAAIPISLLFWPSHSDMKTSAFVDGVQTMADGVPTTAGWVWFIEGVATIGAWGVVGGAAFWLVWRWNNPNRMSETELCRERGA